MVTVDEEADDGAMRDKLFRFAVWPLAVALTILVAAGLIAILVILVPAWFTNPPR